LLYDIISSVDTDAFDAIRLYHDKIVEIQKHGDNIVPLRFTEYTNRRADCLIPIMLSLIYDIMSDIDGDVFDVIRLYYDKIVEIQKHRDNIVPLRFTEYTSKRADCFIPIILSLLYNIISNVDVDAFERIHLKEYVDQLKQGYIYTGIMNTDILISCPVTYNGDGINTSELLVNDIWRFDHQHPLIITSAEIKNKDVTFQQNGITITHEFGSQDQLDMIDDHCLFTHDLVKVYNNED
jgi:hypothetical protein